ncbi:copper resistance protein NlpE [Bordetella genomosp. 13]|uniref:copper resistance protein NlpE n=1 Tax=Bordetella genomosp. 13 TaxID=463040 RepID=UPI001642D05D|nr:copper resistance protein NlpE [Bordetella genomosp. 13]
MAALLFCASLAACVPPAAGPRGEAARAVTAAGSNHARNVLNWVGSYEGVLPCAGCPAVRTRLTLEAAGGYELRMQPQGRSGPPDLTRGAYTWLPDGATIQLDDAGHRRRFQVLQDRVIALPQDGPAPGVSQDAAGALVRLP